MKRKYSGLLFFLLFLGIRGSVFSQVINPQISLYMLNTLAYNPAYTGFSKGISVSALHRQQWLGFSAVNESGEKRNVAPNSSILLADMPIAAIKGGLSLSITSDINGDYNAILFKVGYTYHLKTSFGLIGIGAQVGFNDLNLDFSNLKPDDPADPAIGESQKTNSFLGDLSVGAYLSGNENYFVGISINETVAPRSKKIYTQTTRIAYLSGGYTFAFPSLPKWDFTPSTLIKFNFKDFIPHWDISAIATYQKRFWGGISYRLGDAVIILAGVDIMQFRIGVSYDITNSAISKGTKIGGGFEIYAKYCFSLDTDKVNTNYKNARYL